MQTSRVSCNSAQRSLGGLWCKAPPDMSCRSCPEWFYRLLHLGDCEGGGRGRGGICQLGEDEDLVDVLQLTGRETQSFKPPERVKTTCGGLCNRGDVIFPGELIVDNNTRSLVVFITLRVWCCESPVPWPTQKVCQRRHKVRSHVKLHCLITYNCGQKP